MKPLPEIVRDNVRALRELEPSRRGQRKFAAFCGVGEGTIWRIDELQERTAIGTLQRIAQAHGLEAWMLLVEHFDPNHPPTLAPLTEAERNLYAAMKAAMRETVRNDRT